MAKQIIVLDTLPGDGGRNMVRAAFWFPIQAGKRIPISGATSSWTGASGQELTALADGSVVEEVVSMPFAASYTAAQIRAALLTAWTDRKAWKDAQPFSGQYYGVYYDGSWSA